jgi:predicted DNA-binding transcriptional regulator AlpA
LASHEFVARSAEERNQPLISDHEPTREPPIDSQLAYSLSQLAKITSIGRQRLYDEINAGRLIAVKIGRRTVFRRADIVNWLARARVIEPAGALDAVERALPSATFEPEPIGAARNRPQRRRGDRNEPTPPAPPVAQVRDSRILGQERSQQNPGFLARHRRDKRGADPDIAPPGATRGAH